METVKIIPTVGRVVYYKAYGTPGGEFPAGVDRAAIVTDVREVVIMEGGLIMPFPLQENVQGQLGHQVRLCVMNPTGIFFSNWLNQGEKPGQWDWMPYQKAGAASGATTNSQSAEPRPGVVLNTGTDQGSAAVA